MKHISKLSSLKDKDGKFIKYAWPGGYPIMYFFEDYEVCCPDCANGLNGSDASEDSEDKQWRLIDGDVYWEGPVDYCSHCNCEIESAYGDPEEVENDND